MNYKMYDDFIYTLKRRYQIEIKDNMLASYSIGYFRIVSSYPFSRGVIVNYKLPKYTSFLVQKVALKVVSTTN